MLRIVWGLIAVIILYILGIFFLPTHTDTFADMIGVQSFSNQVRSVFQQSQTLSLDLLEAQEEIDTQEVVDSYKIPLDSFLQNSLSAKDREIHTYEK